MDSFPPLNVVNFAAKLLAFDPSLTPQQVIATVKQGAISSEDGRLIDEKRSVVMPLAQSKR